MPSTPGGLQREGGLAAPGAPIGGPVDLGVGARAWSADGLDLPILQGHPRGRGARPLGLPMMALFAGRLDPVAARRGGGHTPARPVCALAGVPLAGGTLALPLFGRRG